MSTYNPYDDDYRALMYTMGGGRPRLTDDPRVAEAYRTQLGRDMGDEDRVNHDRNPYGVEGILRAISDSPEARAYASRSSAESGNTAGGTGSGGTQANSQRTYDTSTWDHDGWGAPKYIAEDYGGVMAGWDAKNWADANMQTPKYAVGRILSKYTPSSEGLAQAMAEIEKAYPGASYDGKDKITIPGLGVIDVLVNAGGDPGSMSWAWQDQTNAPGSSPGMRVPVTTGTAGAGAGSSATQGALMPELMSDDFYQQLQAEVANLVAGKGSRLDAAALLNMLRG